MIKYYYCEKISRLSLSYPKTIFVAPKIPVVIPVTKSVTLEKSKSWSILSHSVRQNRSSKIEKRKLQSKMRKCAFRQKP